MKASGPTTCVVGPLVEFPRPSWRVLSSSPCSALERGPDRRIIRELEPNTTASRRAGSGRPGSASGPDADRGTVTAARIARARIAHLDGDVEGARAEVLAAF